jgi:thymidylate synthase
MEQISFYLKKFKTLEIKGDKLKKKIIKIVQEKTSVDLEKKDINILKTGEIKIKKTGSEKSIIFLNKKNIENELKKTIF